MRQRRYRVEFNENLPSQYNVPLFLVLRYPPDNIQGGNFILSPEMKQQNRKTRRFVTSHFTSIRSYPPKSINLLMSALDAKVMNCFKNSLSPKKAHIKETKTQRNKILYIINHRNAPVSFGNAVNVNLDPGPNPSELN